MIIVTAIVVSAAAAADSNTSVPHEPPPRTIARPLLGSILNTSDCWPSQMSEAASVRVKRKKNSVFERAGLGPLGRHT